MFDIVTTLTAARALRRACEARCADIGNAEAEHDARLALLNLATGLEVEVYPSRPSRWIGTDAMARNVEAAAEALAEAAGGSFYPAGHIARLTLHFGALASRLGCDVEAKVRTVDDLARSRVEGDQMEAAE
jgi:hypothetical protein